MKKAVHYINQFFGQIGGEDKADFEPEVRSGVVGPGMFLKNKLDAEITHTIICGDNYMTSNTEEALEVILGELKQLDFDIFIAGPAFQAGRYGVACGTICKAIKEEFNVPVVTSMHEENPGVEMFKKEMYIFRGGRSAAAMRSDLTDMANFANKILANEELKDAKTEGYFPRGIRHQVWRSDEKPAADRVIDMLLKKLAGEDFETELPIPAKEAVPIAPPIKELSKATVAFVTSGGIVPVNNPDRIQSASATRWGRYDISDMDRLKAGEYKTIHAGYDPAAADADPNVCVPLDALRAYEKEGKIGKLHDYFYSTVGTGTTQAEAARMANEMIEYFNNEGVDAIILSST